MQSSSSINVTRQDYNTLSQRLLSFFFLRRKVIYRFLNLNIRSCHSPLKWWKTCFFFSCSTWFRHVIFRLGPFLTLPDLLSSALVDLGVPLHCSLKHVWKQSFPGLCHGHNSQIQSHSFFYENRSERYVRCRILRPFNECYSIFTGIHLILTKVKIVLSVQSRQSFLIRKLFLEAYRRWARKVNKWLIADKRRPRDDTRCLKKK